MKETFFDPLRKKHVVLTPEERVRQYFIQWLNRERNYPLSLMMSEYFMEFNSRRMRCDIVCFNKQAQPIVVVECKSPEVKLDSVVADQINKYNLAMKVDTLVITNGVQTYACRYSADTGRYEFIEDIPYYGK